jgi:hypothetical protein
LRRLIDAIAAAILLLVLGVAIMQAPKLLGQATVPVAVDPCMSNTSKSSVAINITSAVTTQLVAISGTKSVYVCGGFMSINSVVTTATTAQFEYGTGSLCATGTVVLTGPIGTGGITAGTPIPVELPSDYTSFSAPSGNALCLVSAGTTVAIGGFITYIQQ